MGTPTLLKKKFHVRSPATPEVVISEYSEVCKQRLEFVDKLNSRNISWSEFSFCSTKMKWKPTWKLNIGSVRNFWWCSGQIFLSLFLWLCEWQVGQDLSAWILTLKIGKNQCIWKLKTQSCSIFSIINFPFLFNEFKQILQINFFSSRAFKFQ